jgi:hypothetical protein
MFPGASSFIASYRLRLSDALYGLGERANKRANFPPHPADRGPKSLSSAHRDRRAASSLNVPNACPGRPVGTVSLHGLGVGYGFLTCSAINPYPTVGRRKQTCPAGPHGRRAGNSSSRASYQVLPRAAQGSARRASGAAHALSEPEETVPIAYSFGECWPIAAK